MRKAPLRFTYDALKYAQAHSPKAPEFVIFSAPARDILQWAEVDRLSENNLKGAQRPLQPLKVRKVVRYLKADQRNTIPTAVIIALDEASVAFKPTKARSNDGPGVIEIKVSPNSDLPGLIIDGQHRVHGVSTFNETARLNVVAMIGGDDAERAFQFVVINNSSARVSKSHVTALNLQFDTDKLNSRLIESAGLTLGMRDQSYDALQVIDAEPPFKGLLGLPTNSKGFIPPNAIESALALTKDSGALLGIEDLELEVFVAIWSAVHKLRKAEWNEDTRLLQKVSIFAVTAYLLDALEGAQRASSVALDFTDEAVLAREVTRLMDVFPKEFWTAEWASKGLDTSAGRQILMGALKLIDANVRHGRPWHKDVELIDAARLPAASRTSKSKPKPKPNAHKARKTSTKKATTKKATKSRR